MRLSALVLAVIGVTGCAASSSVQWDRPVSTPAVPSGGLVSVMEPLVAGSAAPGNVGRDLRAIRRTVADRILAIVRERYPRAQIAENGSPSVAPPQGYVTAAGERLTGEELRAATWASAHGATDLLVPTITTWTEMRTDDPIGALTLPHNRITLTLRLMRLAPPALAGRVTFSNRARLTINQPATTLLDERFRRTVLELISAG